MDHLSLAPLHAPVPWRVVVAEQLRATGLHLRSAAALLLLAYGVLAASMIYLALDVQKTNTSHEFQAVSFSYSPGMTFALLAIAFIIPLIIWQDEDPPRRAYHWSMPVARSAHTMAKAIAGWCWMTFAVAASLLGLLGLVSMTELLTGLPQYAAHHQAWWEWLIPFTSLTVAYTFASAAAIGTRRPIVWLFGSMAGYFGVYMFVSLAIQDHGRVANHVASVVTGYYGAGPAMGGWFRWYDASFAVTDTPTLDRWLGSLVIWATASGVLLAWSLRHRSEL